MARILIKSAEEAAKELAAVAEEKLNEVLTEKLVGRAVLQLLAQKAIAWGRKHPDWQPGPPPDGHKKYFAFGEDGFGGYWVDFFGADDDDWSLSMGIAHAPLPEPPSFESEE